METRIIDTKLSELYGHMERLRSTIEQEKKAINSLEDNSARLKQKLAEETAKNASHDPNLSLDSGSVHKLKNDYNQKIEAKLKEAKQKRSKVDKLEKHVNEAEDIYSELKKQEQAMREVEQKVKTWVEKADRIIR